MMVFFHRPVNGELGIFFYPFAQRRLFREAQHGMYGAALEAPWMTEPTRISQNYAVAPRLDAAGFARAAELGFATIVSFLPDGEIAGAIGAAEAKRLAAQHGLAFAHIPASKYDLFADDVVTPAAHVLAKARGPVLLSLIHI